MGIVLTVLTLALIIGYVTAPFPCWFSVWRLACSLFESNLPLSARRQQLAFLILQLVVTPLRTWLWHLDDWLFPGYRQVTITPIFIIGEPRCGTTHLHRTLASSGHFMAVQHLHWRFPYILLQRLFAPLGITKWLGRRNYWPNTHVGELASTMHPNRLVDWEEDGIFFEENFCHHFFLFLRFPYPQLLAYIDDFQGLSLRIQENMFTAHQKAIQKAAFLKGKNEIFYLSKEVTSHNKIKSLLVLYPQSRFVVVVRESQAFMSSLIALMGASSASKNEGYDPTGDSDWQRAFNARMVRDSNSLVNLCEDVIPRSRQFRVHYNDLQLNISSAVGQIHKWLDLPLKPSFQRYLHLLVTRQRHRDRGYAYPTYSFSGFDRYDKFVASINSPLTDCS